MPSMSVVEVMTAHSHRLSRSMKESRSSVLSRPLKRVRLSSVCHRERRPMLFCRAFNRTTTPTWSQHSLRRPSPNIHRGITPAPYHSSPPRPDETDRHDPRIRTRDSAMPRLMPGIPRDPDRKCRRLLLIHRRTVNKGRVVLHTAAQSQWRIWQAGPNWTGRLWVMVREMVETWWRLIWTYSEWMSHPGRQVMLLLIV